MKPLTALLGAALLYAAGCAGTEDTQEDYKSTSTTQTEDQNCKSSLDYGSTSSSEKDDHMLEYCVIATDDAPVEGPELADLLFDGRRLSSAPYRSYSKEERVITDEFRVGHIAEDSIEYGHTGEFLSNVNKICKKNNHGHGLAGRAKFIFTGPQFDEQKEEPFRYISSSCRTMNDVTWTTHYTEAGRVMETEIAGQEISVIYFDGWMVESRTEG